MTESGSPRGARTARSARLADALLVLFVGGYIVPGALLLLGELVAYLSGGIVRLPYPAPAWPVGS